jgi:hypothetical protein
MLVSGGSQEEAAAALIENSQKAVVRYGTSYAEKTTRNAAISVATHLLSPIRWACFLYRKCST